MAQPEVKNIKITTLGYDNIVATLQDKYKMLKWTAKDTSAVEKMMPPVLKQIRFELRNANTAIANAWRRVMLDELVFPRLKVHTQDIKSDDAFCQRLTDYIQSRVHLIATSYMPPTDVKDEFKLSVTNTSSELVTVTSADIKGDHKGFDWDRRIELIELHPGKTISMKIGIEWGNNITGHFYAVGPIHYFPLDFKEPLPKSNTLHPKDYELGCTVQSDLRDPVEMCLLGWNTLLAKLERCMNTLAEFKKSGGNIPYSSAALKVTRSKGALVVYEFLGETYSTVNILTWYAYVRDSAIKYIQAGDAHQEDPSKLIRINHPDHLNLLIAGCEMSIGEVKSIASNFKI